MPPVILASSNLCLQSSMPPVILASSQLCLQSFRPPVICDSIHLELKSLFSCHNFFCKTFISGRIFFRQHFFPPKKHKTKAPQLQEKKPASSHLWLHSSVPPVILASSHLWLQSCVAPVILSSSHLGLQSFVASVICASSHLGHQ